ncbi:hypothetical protein BY996DRAFT_4582295 [Phakopsora pachyrhizi]|uniref:Calponin-homology (CH) domain-containing protein n=1 Tax=Phakopsora pachyrhizi TaxID=170000 RepID=A0AAV0AWZ4_PHAPC|nr:hypothetical protein BY996DRAFT_4582295 [Phakopsora pachyrhizi]CAH7673002.1 hypothetical protein PPACK8108_LOCUS7863 [Phakopsora pachyrhizi]
MKPNNNQQSSNSHSSELESTLIQQFENQSINHHEIRITDSRLSNRSRKAYYTPQNPRQFSSSAAKRNSVMALGSIAHLQHYFVKHGLANRERPSHHKGMVLAIPGKEMRLTEEEIEVFDELPEPTPPRPVPPKLNFPTGRALPDLTDLRSTTREVMSLLDQVCDAWGLVELASEKNQSEDQSTEKQQQLNGSDLTVSPTYFIVNLLTITTQAVRSVQKFILTLPDPDIFSSSTTMGGDLQRRMSQLELSTAARPGVSRSILGPSRSSSPNPNQRHSSGSSPSPSSANRTKTDLMKLSLRASFDPFMLFKKRSVSSLNAPQAIREREDPLVALRRMSLDVLGCLKDIELRFRIPGSATPTTNDELFRIRPGSEGSDSNGLGMMPSSTERNLTPPLVSNENDDCHSSTSNSTGLILPSLSWEYRNDVGLKDVRGEALVIKNWLECVDGILEGVEIINENTYSHTMSRFKGLSFQSSKNSKGNGIGSNSTTSSTKNPTEIVVTDDSSNPNSRENAYFSEEDQNEENLSDFEEEDLPDWARNDRFVLIEQEQQEIDTSTRKKGRRRMLKEARKRRERDLKLERLFSCLVYHLPAEVLIHLNPPHGEDGSRYKFWDSLSDGTLLCLAYNVALRQSKRPWGFIPVESIHDMINLNSNETVHQPSSSNSEQKRVVVGLTFRRMENLRFWAAALKLRYLIKSEPNPPKGTQQPRPRTKGVEDLSEEEVGDGKKKSEKSKKKKGFKNDLLKQILNPKTKTTNTESNIKEGQEEEDEDDEESDDDESEEEEDLRGDKERLMCNDRVIRFDPNLVARKLNTKISNNDYDEKTVKEQGRGTDEEERIEWLEMLEEISFCWLDCLKIEKREEVLGSR